MSKDARQPRELDSVTDFLHHARVVRSCAAHLGATAEVDLLNFQLRVDGPSLSHTFTPQFIVAEEDDRRTYAPAPRDGTTKFVGWRPFRKRWPLGFDKLAFKQFCSEHGLRTPAYRTDPDPALRGFIIKKRTSSMGYGIRGPFGAYCGSDPEHRLAEDEYYEQFLRGSIAKAWYWEARPVCLELWPMPVVTGDGRRSMYDLIVAGRRSRSAPRRSAFEALARYQGFSLDDVLPAGTSAIADFRYRTGRGRRSRASSNVLPRCAGTEIARQLEAAGPILWGGIPADIRDQTLWTLDAIVDEDAAEVWLLEMNCNPLVHPDAYFAMLEGIFGPPS